MEKEATLACSAGLAAAYHDYTARTAQSSIPALKLNDGVWFWMHRVTFAEKCKLPGLCYNTHTVCTQCHEIQTSVVCPSVEQCMAVLTGLRDDSSTGPDLVPARILKRCAEQLAKPLQSLIQRMLETKSWLESWCEHWVVTIYLKKAVFTTIIEAFTSLHNCRRLSSDYCFHSSSLTSVAQLLSDETSLRTPNVEEHEMHWPTSRCHGSLRSTAARMSRSTVRIFREAFDSSSRAFTGETPMQRSTHHDGIVATATHGTCGG